MTDAFDIRHTFIQTGRKMPGRLFKLNSIAISQMDEIEKNDFNLNISRYISTAVGEAEINLTTTHKKLVEIETVIQTATQKHNGFLQELGLPDLP